MTALYSNRADLSGKVLQKWQALFSALVFFMAFPGIILVFNMSLYYFMAIVYLTITRVRVKKIQTNSYLIFFLLAFALGAVISTFNVPEGIGSENFYRSLRSLPNYLYWTLLTYFFIWYRRLVDFEVVRKYVFYGVVCYIPFWFLQQFYLKGIPFFQDTSHNNLAFLMIAYSPIAISYLKYNYSLLKALLFFVIILFLMLYLERRAGFILVFSSGIMTLFVNRIRFRNFARYAVALVAFYMLLQFSFIEGLVYSVSPRVHELVYLREEMYEGDHSYLTRLAMIEKGIAIFNEHPSTGVGIFNFTHVNADIRGNFMGAELVIRKDNIQNTGAHNSYLAVLAEGGLVLFIPWVLLIVSIFWKFVRNISNISYKNYPLFWGCFGMFFHYFSGTGYVNVYSWFIIAMASVAVLSYQEKSELDIGKNNL